MLPIVASPMHLDPPAEVAPPVGVTVDPPSADAASPAPVNDRPTFWTGSPYVLVSNPTASADRVGLGGEISLMFHGPATFENLFCMHACTGVLVQAESVPSVRLPERRVGRFAVAGQEALGPLGVELGPALETTPSGGALLGVHSAFFFSIGVGSAALRLSAYPGRFGEADRGFEAAFVVRETIPLALPLVYAPKTGDLSPAFFTHALGRFPM